MGPKKEKMTCLNLLCTKKGLKLCTQCYTAWYCSKECQVQHWKRHKKCCKMISSSTEMNLRYIKACEDYNAVVDQIETCTNDQTLVSLQELLEIFKEFQYDEFISGCYYNIGQALLRKDRYEEALVNYRKALEIKREINGENHASTCDCYEAIGTLMGCQGRYDDALIGYGKALAIRMKIFGENHIDIGRSYYNIGIAQSLKGDFNGALISLQKVKRVYTSELGKNVQIDFCQKRMDQSKKPI